jgi:tetratricopeptide (TPR) repeat protein
MKPYELVLTNRSAESDVIQLMMNNAQDKFLKGEFEAAIGFFEEVLEINSNKVEADFYMGISYMEIDQHSDASKSFTRVIEHNDNLYIQKAEWYLAGCLLAMDETDRARRQLGMIASSANHYYKDDAAKILKRMKR